jgi:hypothetical protein
LITAGLGLFTLVGPGREVSAVTLRLVGKAILGDDIALAGAILDQVQPESPDKWRSHRRRMLSSGCSTIGYLASPSGSVVATS